MIHAGITDEEQTLKQRSSKYCIRSLSYRSVTGRSIEVCRLQSVRQLKWAGTKVCGRCASLIENIAYTLFLIKASNVLTK